jgi:hypothetical protein
VKNPGRNKDDTSKGPLRAEVCPEEKIFSSGPVEKIFSSGE